jgi:hypothetical protein
MQIHRVSATRLTNRPVARAAAEATTRPVGALRGDLADRTLPINLDRIEESARLTERQLNERWTQDQPRIFGDLLSLAASLIKRLPSVRLASSPRMADFARILVAVDQILGTNGLIRFAERARTMAEDTLSADPFIAAMTEARIDFHGKSADLLIKITPDEQGWRPPRNWPKDPRVVTSLLRRNAPAMRKVGWVVEEGEDLHNNHAIWTVISPEIGRKSGSQDSQGAKSGDVCTVCAGPLLAPHSQQRGICEKCWLRMPDDEARSA